MRLLDKYSKGLKKIKNPEMISLLSGVEVFEWDSKISEGQKLQKAILTGQNASIEQVAASLIKHDCDHFVQEGQADFFYDLLASVLMLKKPAQLLENPKPLLLASLRNSHPSGNDHQKQRNTIFEFHSEVEKGDILKGVRRFLEDDPKTANLVENVSVLADELISYTMVRAPKKSMQVEAGGRALRGRIFILHDEFRLIVGCHDLCGSYEKKEIKESIYQASKLQIGEKLSSDQQEALRLKIILENSSSFYLVVQKEKKSMLMCALPLGISLRKFAATPKNLHICFF